jgi:tRNA1(Val) A37 N6-methylase TrmN6
MNCDPMNPSEFTEDGFLGGKLILRQPRSGHRAGHDAILLAAASAAQPGARVADLGAGIGAAGLALATRVHDLDLALVEIDPVLAAMAQHNAARNGIAAHAVVLDVAGSADRFAEAGLAPDSFDAVLMNPPFNDAARHRPSPDAQRRMAHVAGGDTLELWVHAARRMLKSGGALSLIWRAEDVSGVLAALSRGFGAVAVMPVHPRAGAPAIRVLVGAVKGARAPLKLLPGLDLEDAADVLRGERVLTLF